MDFIAEAAEAKLNQILEELRSNGLVVYDTEIDGAIDRLKVTRKPSWPALPAPVSVKKAEEEKEPEQPQRKVHPSYAKRAAKMTDEERKAKQREYQKRWYEKNKAKKA